METKEYLEIGLKIKLWGYKNNLTKIEELFNQLTDTQKNYKALSTINKVLSDQSINRIEEINRLLNTSKKSNIKKHSQKKYKNAFAKWTDEIDDDLLENFKSGHKVSELSLILGRSSTAIYSRLKHLKAFKISVENSCYCEYCGNEIKSEIEYELAEICEICYSNLSWCSDCGSVEVEDNGDVCDECIEEERLRLHDLGGNEDTYSWDN